MRWVRSMLVIADKDFRLARSYKLAFPFGVFSAFFGLVSFRFISKLVTGGQFHGSSASYFRYAVVGLVLASVVAQAAATPSGAARQDQLQGTLEYLASQPIARSALGYGWSFYNVVQTLVISVIACALFLPLGLSFHVTNLPAAVAALLLILVVFSSLGNLGASAVVAFQQGQQFVTVITAALSLLSGTVFPIAELPSWVRPIARVSPLYDALNVLRHSLLAAQPPTDVAHELLTLLVWAVVVAPLSIGILQLAFLHAQRRGSLGIF